MLFIFESPEQSVFRVVGVATSKHLSGENAVTVKRNREMNVRDSTRIRNRLNCAKVVFAFAVCEEPPVALKVGVSFFGAG